jgi:hypothetical protein
MPRTTPEAGMALPNATGFAEGEGSSGGVATLAA